MMIYHILLKLHGTGKKNYEIVLILFGPFVISI